MRVSLHINLHRKRPSITAREGERKGRVIGNPPAVAISNVTFVVSEKRRQRVLAKRCRDVHAFAYGDEPTTDDATINRVVTEGERIHYNPYRAGHFHLADGTPVHAAKAMALVGPLAYVLL